MEEVKEEYAETEEQYRVRLAKLESEKITAENLRKAGILKFIEDEPKPQIKIPNVGKLASKFVEEVAHILKDKNVLFFRPEAKDIVEINKIVEQNQKIEYLGFNVVKPNRMITLIEKYMIPGVVVEVGEGVFKFKEKSINNSMASIVIESAQLHENLPKIRRIFTAPIPIMYQGKLEFPKRGYDERFCSWLPIDAPDIENTNLSVQQAKEIILDLFKEFCFKDKQDYTNAVAALITPFLRGLFKSFSTRTPVFFYLANRERAGKDYCAGITSILYEGYATEEPPISNSEKGASSNNDELRKKILAALMNGRKRLHFSNNRGYIDNAVFEGIITAEKYSDRVLGRSEILTLDNELDFSLSGNVGVGFTPDLANRSRLIRLFLDIEDANQRHFTNPNLHLYVKNHRGLILSALYALVKNWVDKGAKNGSEPFASFPEWAQVCGGIMEAAGYESPCQPDRETLGLGGDAETQDMKALFELCYEAFPEEWINKNRIKAIVHQEESIFPYLDFEKKSDQTKFGNLIRKFIGRVLSDVQLIVKDQNVRASRHEYMFSKQKPENNKNKIFGTEKDGHLGNLCNLYQPRLIIPTNINIGVETLPRLPRLPNKCYFCQEEKEDLKELEGNLACKDCYTLFNKTIEKEVIKC